jgi:hypothetical protein
MKKFFLTALLCVALRAQAYAGDLLVINETTAMVVNVYISPSNSGSWGPDWLEGVIMGGDSKHVYFNADDTCYFDLKAQFFMASPVEQDSVNLCNVSSWTLYYRK